MPYTLVEATDSRLVFRRDSSNSFVAAACLVAGGLALAGGICGWSTAAGGSEFHATFFPMLAVAGLLVFAAGSWIAFARQRFDPREVTFDNEAGAVRVVQDAAASQVALIPYPAIERFGIRIRRLARSSSATVVTDPRSYVVYILRGDGGEWDLVDTQSEAAARALLATLEAKVKLDRPPGPSGDERLRPPAKLEVRRRGEGDTVTWRNPVGGALAGLIGILSCVGLVLVGFFRLMRGDLFFEVGLGFVALVFVVVVVTSASRSLRDAWLRYGITVGRGGLEHFTEDARGERRVVLSIPIEDVGGIVHDFTFDKLGTADLQLLTRAQAERKRATVDGIGLGEVKGVLSDALEAPDIRIAALNAVEHLQLERWLAERVARLRAGRAGS